MATKEYGKLSADQFRRLIRKLPEVRAGTKELPDLLRSSTSEKLRAALDEGIYWAGFYELPFAQHVALGMFVLGQKDWLIEMTNLEDPQEAMLRFLDSGEELDGKGPDGQELSLAAALAVVASFQRSILSIMLYKRSMSALVEEVRKGNDKSLFDAVRIDRSALTCPTIALRISKAEIRNERHFFDSLRKALKGPSKKHWEGYGNLRYSLAVLRELGFDAMSDAELEHLLVDVLKVYPKSSAARKNLRRQFYESGKMKTL